eukprot:g7784.t1
MASNKRTAASSSAAAKALHNSDHKLTSFGFGGFAGEQQVQLTGDVGLPSEVHQYFKQLTKKNTTTKLKALQNLDHCLNEMTVDQFSVLFPQWVVQFRQLNHDLDKGVRIKSVEALDRFVRTLKRELAPYLKSIIGPWWISQHDEHSTVAKIAQKSFQSAFPGEKSMNALLFCGKDLVKYLCECLQETVETIGDPKKDSKEEREFKFLLLMRATLSGTRDFISKLKGSKKDELSMELMSQLSDVVFTKTFLKKILSSVMSDVRAQSYQLIHDLNLSVKDSIKKCIRGIGPTIFNSLAEKDPSCQQEMWSMILTLIKSFPEVWESISLQKFVVPKLSAVLRKRRSPNEDSDDALLLFINQIPPEHWNQSPQSLVKIFNSSWEGLMSQNTSTAPKLLLECFLWGLLSAAKLAPETESSFRAELIQQIMNQTVFLAILTNTKLVLSFLVQTIRKLVSMVADRSENGPVLMGVMDCIRMELVQSIDQEGMPEIVGDLIEEACAEQIFRREAKKVLLEALGHPIGHCLSHLAFSTPPSSSHAICLLKSSRALRQSILYFNDTEAESVVFQIFDRIKQMIENSMEEDSVVVYFDLMMFCLGEGSDEVRKCQWNRLISSIEVGLQQDKQKWNKIFASFLGSINQGSLKHVLKLSKLPKLSTFNVRCIELLIKLIHDLLTREYAFISPLAEILMQSNTVENSDSTIQSGWTELMVKLVSIAWDLAPESADIREPVVIAWDKGSVLNCLESDLRQNLVIAIENEAVNHISKGLDPDKAASILEEVLSFTPDPEALLNRVFNEDSFWTHRTDSELSYTPLPVLCSLIKKTGPSSLDPDYNLTPVLFLELLCDPQVDPEVLNQVLDHLMDTRMKGNDKLVIQLVDRCLDQLKAYPENVHFYSTALQSILIALKHSPDQLQIIQSIEKISNRLINSLEFPLQHSSQEALVDILPHVIPVLRQNSLLSVVNGNLEELSIACLEETGRMSLLTKICLLCFPMPESKPLPALYATANEKISLLNWIDTNEVELWRRIAVYCSSVMEDIHWRKLQKKLLTYLRQKIHIFEAICEDLMQLASSIAKSFTSEIQSPVAVLHLLSRLNKSNQTVQKMFSNKVEEFATQWSIESVNIMEFIKAASILNQFPVQAEIHPEILESLSLSIRVIFCFGISLHLGAILSPDLYQYLIDLFAGANPEWNQLINVLELCSSEKDLLIESIEGIELWSDVTGVDAVSCLLELISSSPVLESLRQHCVKLLCLEPCVNALVLEDEFSELCVEDWQQKDTLHILTAAGIHHQLAKMLVSGDLKPLMWSLLLMKMETCNTSHCQKLFSILRSIPSLLDGLMEELVPLLPLPNATGKRNKDFEEEVLQAKQELEIEVMRRKVFTLAELVSTIGLPLREVEWQVLAIKIYNSVVSILPVSVRLWFTGLNSKSISHSISYYTVICESPQLIEKHLSLIPQDGTALCGMKVKSVPAKREVIAKMEVEEGTNVELVIKLPECLPLKPITVDWDTKVNIGNSMVRRWLFSVSTFLANHSGPLMEAIELWKKSLQSLMDKEKCLICFCVVHPTTKETPDLTCKTCKLEFHSTCLYTWFRQSSKSTCPHCQSPWNA